MCQPQVFERHAVPRVTGNRLLEQRYCVSRPPAHEMGHREQTQRVRITGGAAQDLFAKIQSACDVASLQALASLLQFVG